MILPPKKAGSCSGCGRLQLIGGHIAKASLGFHKTFTQLRNRQETPAHSN
jgi:hypothetical protein